jgi:ribosome-binding factor A
MKKTRNPVSGVEYVSPSPDEPGVMARRQPSTIDLREIRALAAELRPGDGVDPRLEAKRRRRVRSDPPGLAPGVSPQGRLAAQVREVIDSVLQTAVTPILNSLTVREVVKQGGSLLVVVEPRSPDQPLDLKAAAEAIKHASSMLRREMASAITRKDAPNLSFVVLPAGAEKVSE